MFGWSAAKRLNAPASCAANADWICGKSVTFSARFAAARRRSADSVWAWAAASRTRLRADTFA
jgi:hypothetical protein